MTTPTCYHARGERVLRCPRVSQPSQAIIVVTCSRTTDVGIPIHSFSSAVASDLMTRLPFHTTIFQAHQQRHPRYRRYLRNANNTSVCAAVVCVPIIRVSLPWLPPSSDITCQSTIILPSGEQAAIHRQQHACYHSCLCSAAFQLVPRLDLARPTT